MGLWVSPHLLFVPILYYLCPFSLPVKQDNPPLFLTLGMSYWQSGQAVKKRAAGRKAFTQTIPKTITCLLTWNIPSPLTHQGLKLLAIHFSVPPSGPPPPPQPPPPPSPRFPSGSSKHLSGSVRLYCDIFIYFIEWRTSCVTCVRSYTAWTATGISRLSTYSTKK